MSVSNTSEVPLLAGGFITLDMVSRVQMPNGKIQNVAGRSDPRLFLSGHRPRRNVETQDQDRVYHRSGVVERRKSGHSHGCRHERGPLQFFTRRSRGPWCRAGTAAQGGGGKIQKHCG
jgi:hypothetical protein